MGSNDWLIRAKRVAAAIGALCVTTFACAGDFSGVKGHIDIPEIARGPGGGKGLPGSPDIFAPIGGEEFEAPYWIPSPQPPEEPLPRPQLFGGDFEPQSLTALRSLEFGSVPLEFDAPAVGSNINVVPVPGVSALMLVGAVGLLRRRRA